MTKKGLFQRAAVAAADSELQAKLQKWKQSADTEKPVFSPQSSTIETTLGENEDHKKPPLPPKSLRFQRQQLQRVLDGDLNPPPAGKKKWTSRDVRGLLDLVTMRLRAEAGRKRREQDKEELMKAYDRPRTLDGVKVKGQQQEEEPEVELRSRAQSKVISVVNIV